MDQANRKSVSVMIGGVHSFFPREMISGMSRQAAQEDMNVFFFLRIHTKPFFKSVLGDFSNNAYDYQFNTIHDYCRISGTDGCIIGYGTIGFHLTQDNSRAFAARYNDRPLVFVTEKVDLPNCHNIIADNRQGIFEVVSHLVSVDHCRKILFMRGPVSNTDAIERYEGYLAAMASHNLPVFDHMIGLGDFTSSVDAEIERVLDDNPDADAFVFANDEMAASCYRVCEKRGLRVGEDLKITGFDGGEFADKLIPPLTSVFQDAYGMGAQAVQDMARILSGEPLEDTRYPIKLSIRQSCGCPLPEEQSDPIHHDYRAELRAIRKKAAQREAALLEYQGKSWFIPMIARDLNDNLGSEVDFCQEMMEKLKLLQVNAAYLFLLDHSIHYDGKSEWTCPDNLYLASYCRGDEVFAYQTYDRPHVTPEQGIAQLTDDGKAHQFMVFLLFSGDRQYGLLACDVPVEELAFFYIVSLQLGLSLQYLEMNQLQELHRREMSQDMERIRARNKELDTLSGYDHLTGLLNLRGLTQSVSQLAAEQPGQSAHLIYCDLDHLKQVNDNFGHSEGNYAITTGADILRSCIRGTDKLARIGGDEFLCLVLSESPDFPERFRTRLRSGCAQVNETSGKPYFIELSAGIETFCLNSFEDFQQAMLRADKHLYEAKKNRRADIRREGTE